MKHSFTALSALLYLSALFLPGFSVCAQQSDTAPEFSIQLVQDGGGYLVMGNFPDISLDMHQVRPYYSFDGKHYQPVDENGFFDWELNVDDEYELSDIQNQACAPYSTDPLLRYLSGSVDSFCIKLQFETADGAVQETQSAWIRRGNSKPLPENQQVMADFPPTLYDFYAHGKLRGIYQVTVQAGSTSEELYKLLPATLPLSISLKQGSQTILAAPVPYEVQWNLPEAIPEDGMMLELPASAFIPPERMEIRTHDSIYVTDIPPAVTYTSWFTSFVLIVNTVPKNEAVSPNLYWESTDMSPPVMNLEIGFPLKPSGAQQIIPFWSADNGATWHEGTDLLLRNAPVDAWPKQAYYEHVLLFQKEESPVKEYLAGELDGFLVRLSIKGGVFDGQSAVITWPSEYTYVPPKGNNNGDGSGGNRGDAGSSNNANHGQRPGVSDSTTEQPAEQSSAVFGSSNKPAQNKDAAPIFKQPTVTDMPSGKAAPASDGTTGTAALKETSSSLSAKEERKRTAAKKEDVDIRTVLILSALAAGLILITIYIRTSIKKRSLTPPEA